MSDANQMRLAYAVESTYKTPPSGSYQKVRFVSESLRQETASVTSQEIRDDRQTSDIQRTSVSAAGDLTIEFSYGAYDDLFEGAFHSSWASQGTSLGPVTTIAIASGTLTDSGSGLSVFSAGNMIRVSGFTGSGASSNGVYVVSSAIAGSLTVVGGFPADQSSGDSITIEECDDILENGTNLSTFTFEKAFLDLSNEFVLNRGMAVDGFSLAVSPESLITGGFTFVGGDEVSATSAQGSGYDNAPTNTVMNGIDNITSVVEGTGILGVTNFSCQLQNNLRARLQVGTLGAISLGTGQINLTGTLQAYFTTKALMDKYRNFTTSSLIVGFVDAQGNNYLLQIPSVNFTSGQQVAGGINTDILADLQFTAKLNPTLNKTMRLGRWAA